MIVSALNAAIETAKKSRMYAMSAAEKASMDAFSIQQTCQDIEGMHEQIFEQSEMLQEKFDTTEDTGDDDWSQIGAWKEDMAELCFRNYELSLLNPLDVVFWLTFRTNRKLRHDTSVRMDKEPSRFDHIENTTLLCLLLAKVREDDIVDRS